MPYPLNNVTVSSDSYTEAATVKFQRPMATVAVTVNNAAVYAQIERCEPGMRAGSGSYLAEEYWLPGVYSISRDHLLGSIRFRRAVAATPNPQVSAR